MKKGELYRFSIIINSERLEFRSALHPSESLSFFITRVLAFTLNYQPNIRFSAGVCIDEAPICVTSETGEFKLWIDINPNSKRIERAMKIAEKVCIYTFQKPDVLKRNWKRVKRHHNSVQAFYLDSVFLEHLESVLERDNHWMIEIKPNNFFNITIAQQVFEVELKPIILDESKNSFSQH